MAPFRENPKLFGVCVCVCVVCSDENRDSLGASEGAIKRLVQLLSNETSSVPLRAWAARAIGNLSYEHQANIEALFTAGAISPLVKLLEEGTPKAKRNAAGALANLASREDAHKAEIAKAGAIAHLVPLLSLDNALVQAMGCRALCNLADLGPFFPECTFQSAV